MTEILSAFLFALVTYVIGYMRGHSAGMDEWEPIAKEMRAENERLTEIVRLREMYER